MLDWRERILDHVFEKQIGPYLMQNDAKVGCVEVGEHDKLHAGGCLVIMELVFAGTIRYEPGGVIVSALVREVGGTLTRRPHRLVDGPCFARKRRLRRRV